MLACAATFATTSVAQTYPSKPIRVLHGFAPGSAIDVFSRPLAQKLSEALGQQVLVDARPGATGTIANELVSKATPDGYTLLAAPGSAMASTPHIYAIRYKALDFTPIIQISDFSYVLIAHPAVPARSARELIALAKAKPGMLTFGSTGVGSGFHLAGELFCSMAGINLLHVPFRGGGTAAVIDVVAGRVDLMWDSLGVVRPYVEAGRLRVIGVTGERRAAALPQAPTIAESGLPAYHITGWHGILGPPGLPREIVNTLNTTVAKILATPEVKQLWNTLAMEIVPNTPEQFRERLRFDYERYGKLIKAIGLKPQV
jgi:tripartite-type tricarboxylate transporter receptor subunit TctC